MTKFHFFWKAKIGQWSIDHFTDGERTYNCCEQYMMAQKAILFGDGIALTKIMSSNDPRDQKRHGREVANFNQEIWNKKARIIVYNGNYLRFSQNSKSKKVLMETDGELVEASPFDSVWGIKLSADNPDAKDKTKWQGKNWLGEVLTQLREDFKSGKAELISLDKDWINGRP